jgi:hypothetical protein
MFPVGNLVSLNCYILRISNWLDLSNIVSQYQVSPGNFFYIKNIMELLSVITVPCQPSSQFPASLPHSSLPAFLTVPCQPSSQFPASLPHSSLPAFLHSSLPAFLAIGCGSGFLTLLVGRSSLPLPPWVTRRCGIWRGKASHRLQHSHVTPPPSYLGPGEGDGQQQQQQQYFNPHPSARPASSIPFLLPPYCITCSVHVWRGASQLSWFTRQWVARWRPVCIAALQQLHQQQLHQQQQLIALRRREESALTTREGR